MAVVAPQNLQQGYAVVVQPKDGSATYELAIMNTPAIKRTGGILYDTVDLEVANSLGGIPLSVEDVILLYKDGILQMHGLVVAIPETTFDDNGQILRFTAASRQFLLWKKRSGDWNFTGIDDGEALETIFGSTFGSTLPFLSPTEFSTFYQVALVNARLQLANSSPGVFYPTGTAQTKPVQVRGEIKKITTHAVVPGSRASVFRDPINGPTFPTFVDPNVAKTTALYDSFFGRFRNQDGVVNLTENYDDFSNTLDYQNVALTAGSVVLAGLTYQKLFASQSTWAFQDSLSICCDDGVPAGGSVTLAANSGGDRLAGFSAMRETDNTILFGYVTWLAAGNTRYDLKRYNESTGVITAISNSTYAGNLDATIIVATYLFRYGDGIYFGWLFTAGVTVINFHLLVSGTTSAPATSLLPFTAAESDNLDSLKLVVMPDGVLYAYHTRRSNGARIVKKYQPGTLNWAVTTDQFTVPSSTVPQCHWIMGPDVSPTGQYYALVQSQADATRTQVYFRDGSGTAGAQWVLCGGYDSSIDFTNLVFMPLPTGNVAASGAPWVSFPNQITAAGTIFGYGVGPTPFVTGEFKISSYPKHGGAVHHGEFLMLDTGADFPRATLFFTLNPDTTHHLGWFSICDGRYRFMLADGSTSSKKRVFVTTSGGGAINLCQIAPELDIGQDSEIRFEIDQLDGNQANWTCKCYIRGVYVGFDLNQFVYETQGATKRYLGRMAFFTDQSEAAVNGCSMLLDGINMYPRSMEGQLDTGFIVYKKVGTLTSLYRAWIEASQSAPSGTSVYYEVSGDLQNWYPITPSIAGAESYVNFLVSFDVTSFYLRVTLTTTNASKPSVSQVISHVSDGYLAGPYKATTLNINPDATLLKIAFVKILSPPDSDVFTVPGSTTVTWRVSSNGGVNWTTATLGVEAAIPGPEQGTDLRIEVTMATTVYRYTSYLGSLAVQYRDSASGTTTTISVSRDGGANFHVVTPEVEFDFTAFPGESPQNVLVYKFDLATTISTSSPSVTEASYTAIGTGFTWFRLGSATEVISVGQDYPLRAYYQVLGQLLQDLVSRMGVDAWWEFNDDTGVYVLHYNAPRTGQDAAGALGLEVLNIKVRADGLKSATRWYLIGEGAG